MQKQSETINEYNLKNNVFPAFEKSSRLNLVQRRSLLGRSRVSDGQNSSAADAGLCSMREQLHWLCFTKVRRTAILHLQCHIQT